MNAKEMIMKNMKPYTKTKPDTPLEEDVWKWPDGSLEDYTGATLKVKASTLAAIGKVHIQFACADVEGLHSDMKEHLQTPFVFLGDNAMRNYGIAINLSVKHGSIDESNIQALGKKVMADKNNLCKSFASETTDYAIMVFEGVVDGEDNKGEPVKMLDFRVGAPENKMLIAFSHIESSIKTDAMNYPEIRGEWLMAWLVSRYMTDEVVA